MLSTGAEKRGDIMFVLGCFAEERVVPVGASFAHRGMPYIRHDAVGAQLMIPIGRTQAGGPGTATSGAPQPAADAQAETDDGMSEPCWDGDTSQDSQAEELAERLREAEEDDDALEPWDVVTIGASESQEALVENRIRHPPRGNCHFAGCPESTKGKGGGTPRRTVTP